MFLIPKPDLFEIYCIQHNFHWLELWMDCLLTLKLQIAVFLTPTSIHDNSNVPGYQKENGIMWLERLIYLTIWLSQTTCAHHKLSFHNPYYIISNRSWMQQCFSAILRQIRVCLFYTDISGDSESSWLCILKFPEVLTTPLSLCYKDGLEKFWTVSNCLGYQF